MPIPAFNIQGVLPPYVGPHGPGGAAEDMSPYATTATEVVTTLGTTDGRKTILRGWLKHRAALRNIGVQKGFQWLDGSFVEDKDPQDLDVVLFFHRPPAATDLNQLVALIYQNIGLFERNQVKAAFRLDFFAVDLGSPLESIVNLTRYYFGLFSHRRVDEIWKGMLQVRIEDAADDAAALVALGPELPAATTAGGTNP
jgi:hypothetical protein